MEVGGWVGGGGGVWGKMMPEWARVWSVGTSGKYQKITPIELHWLIFQTKNTQQNDHKLRLPLVTRVTWKLAIRLECVQASNNINRKSGNWICLLCSFSKARRTGDAMVTSRTCQISSKMSQISVEVIKPDLRCQEDVLRLRKREHALLCACILLDENI